MTENSPALLETKNRALQLLQQGFHADARSLFRDVCEKDPDDEGARYMLAVADIYLGNYISAEDNLRLVLKNAAGMPDVHLMLGQALQGQQKFNDAIESYRAALSIQPDVISAHYNLGLALHAIGDRDAALESYNQALKIMPGHVDALSNRGIIYREQDNLDAAESSFREALLHRPDLDYLRGVLGVTLVQNGKQDEGLEMLRSCLRIQSDRINTLKIPDPAEKVIDIDGKPDTTDASASITIATSLAPNNIDNQRAAIDSWINLGFNVVSINSAEEINALQEDFRDIHFITAGRNAGETCGKPYIYFDDFLSYFDGSDERICGIINSDIHLSNKHLLSAINREAPNSFIFGCRVDVGSLNNRDGKVFMDGFDYFFFDRKFIAIYPEDEFCLGLPWWDYWAVLVPLLEHVPVKKLVTPVAHHITHQINWDDDNWKRLGFRVAAYAGLPDNSTVQMLGYCARYIVFLIEKYSQKISIHDLPSSHHATPDDTNK